MGMNKQRVLLKYWIGFTTVLLFSDLTDEYTLPSKIFLVQENTFIMIGT